MAIANPYQPNANPTSTITTAGTITSTSNSWGAVIRTGDNSEANIKAVTVSGAVTLTDDYADGRVLIDGVVETVFGGVMFVPSSLTDYHSSKLYIVWLDGSTVPQVVRYFVSTGTYVSPASPGPDKFYRATSDVAETEVTAGYIIGECITDGSGFFLTITPYNVGIPFAQVLSQEVANTFFTKGTASSELSTATELDNWALNNAITIIENLAATNALIANLIAGNLQVGPGDGTAASGFRFRVRAYDDSGVALSVPLWDIYYDDTAIMQVICGGTDVGDIIIGDYQGDGSGNGIKWDNSTGILSIEGNIDVTDGSGNNVFNVDNTTGDVTIGDYSNGAGALWDESEDLLTIKGSIEVVDGSSNNIFSVDADSSSANFGDVIVGKYQEGTSSVEAIPGIKWDASEESLSIIGTLTSTGGTVGSFSSDIYYDGKITYGAGDTWSDVKTFLTSTIGLSYYIKYPCYFTWSVKSPIVSIYLSPTQFLLYFTDETFYEATAYTLGILSIYQIWGDSIFSGNVLPKYSGLSSLGDSSTKFVDGYFSNTVYTENIDWTGFLSGPDNSRSGSRGSFSIGTSDSVSPTDGTIPPGVYQFIASANRLKVGFYNGATYDKSDTLTCTGVLNFTDSYIRLFNDNVISSVTVYYQRL